MKNFLERTWKLNRHLVSDDFKKTLDVINERIPLTYHTYPTGRQYFDWVVPKKWVINDAYIEDENRNKVLDWKKNPLHVVSGSLPINQTISKEELLKKTYVSEKYHNLIPYIFKFYELDWGFCMSKNDRDNLRGDKFKVVIDSKYVDDYMYLGEHVIKGQIDKSFILMAHIDHPAQVNDDLAGAAILLKLAEDLKNFSPYYTLKFQFLAERIGSIAYLAEAEEKGTIDDIVGAIFCEMPGTPNYPITLQHSKFNNSIVDRISKYVLKRTDEEVKFANCFEHVVNDDGVYNSPDMDIPCVSISRAKKLEVDDWNHFPYYHTSGDNLDNLDFIQMERTLDVFKEILNVFNKDRVIYKNYKGVLHLSRHNLWVDAKLNPELHKNIYKLLYVMDNGRTIFDLCEQENIDFNQVYGFMKTLEEKDLVHLTPTDKIWQGDRK